MPVTVQIFSRENEVSDAEKPGDEFPNNVLATEVVQTARAFITPLVLDLDGDGVELTSIDQGTLFDLNNDGILDRTGFVAADDGLLALDRNGDGIINNQSELFGNSDTAEDGFARLSELDSNGDGVFDTNDDAFDDVVIFQDLNQDGVSDANELFSLADHGIASIDLNAIDLEATGDEYFLEGNIISDVSSFTRVDGTVGEIVDALFQVELGAGETPDIVTDNIVDVVDQSVLDGFGVASLTDTFQTAQQDVFSTAESGEEGDTGVIDLFSVIDTLDQDAVLDFVTQTSDATDPAIDAGDTIVALPFVADVIQPAGYGFDDVTSKTDTGF